MYCMKCGQSLPDDARFCAKCGTPILPPAPNEGNIGPLQAGVTHASNKPSAGKVPFCLIGLLLGGLMGIMIGQALWEQSLSVWQQFEGARRSLSSSFLDGIVGAMIGFFLGSFVDKKLDRTKALATVIIALGVLLLIGGGIQYVANLDNPDKPAPTTSSEPKRVLSSSEYWELMGKAQKAKEKAEQLSQNRGEAGKAMGVGVVGISIGTITRILKKKKAACQ